MAQACTAESAFMVHRLDFDETRRLSDRGLKGALRRVDEGVPDTAGWRVRRLDFSEGADRFVESSTMSGGDGRSFLFG